MARNGAKFAVVDQFWSAYRLHEQSVTGSKSSAALVNETQATILSRVKGRKPRGYDILLTFGYRLLRHVLNPRDTWSASAGDLYLAVLWVIELNLTFAGIFRRSQRRAGQRSYEKDEMRFRELISLVSILLPWPLHRAILVHVLGYKTDRSAKIGFSLICPTQLEMGPKAIIGHLTLCKWGVDFLKLEDGAIVGNLNWITAVPLRGALILGMGRVAARNWLSTRKPLSRTGILLTAQLLSPSAVSLLLPKAAPSF